MSKQALHRNRHCASPLGSTSRQQTRDRLNATVRSARRVVLAGAAVAALCGLQRAGAATQTWTGAGGDPTDFGLNTNLSNNTLPVTNGDVALFNGLAAGNLALIDTTNSFPGTSGEAGLTISLGVSQAGSVSIDSPGNQ